MNYADHQLQLTSNTLLRKKYPLLHLLAARPLCPTRSSMLCYPRSPIRNCASSWSWRARRWAGKREPDAKSATGSRTRNCKREPAEAERPSRVPLMPSSSAVCSSCRMRPGWGRATRARGGHYEAASSSGWGMACYRVVVPHPAHLPTWLRLIEPPLQKLKTKKPKKSPYRPFPL